MPFALYLLTNRTNSPSETIGGVLSLVFASGTIGGLAGHDLVHHKRLAVKWFGILTLTTMNYGHFAVSHLLGHHRSVGLKKDWSTARYRESIYQFLYRAIVHGYIGAWALENQRLRASSRKWFSPRNQMIQISLVQAALTCSVLYWGIKVFGIHWVFSFVSFCLLETVNLGRRDRLPTPSS